MKLLASAAAASVCALLAAPAPASATLYIFEQTGDSTTPNPSSPPPTFTASIEINGTLADMPTLNSDDLYPVDPDLPPIDYGKLVALNISTTAGLFDTTLEDFGYPLYLDMFPDWEISPAGLYFNSAWNEYEFWIEGFGDDSIIGHRADSGTCYLTDPACIAPGRWVEASAVPEPLTIWTFAAGLVGLLGFATYAGRRRSTLASRSEAGFSAP